MWVLESGFSRPWVLVLAPLVLVLLYLLERWRRRPVVLEVADLDLFRPSSDADAEAQARRRQLGLRWLARALAALLLIAAGSGARLPAAAPGPVTVELVLDAGISSGVSESQGLRLDLHRGHLTEVLARLRAEDRVRIHALPSGAFPAPARLSPAEARAALQRVRPTAARVDVVGAVDRLAAAAVHPGRVFVATDRVLPAQPGVAVAYGGTRRSNWGILGMEREGDVLFVALAATGAEAGEVELAIVARGAEASTEAHLRVELPSEGVALARWGGLPPGVREVSARLVEGDALAADDQAFAVTAPVSVRRVGIVGDPGPAVERALRAVPGVAVEYLGGASPESTREAAGRCDLLILDRVPQTLLPVATVVVPLSVPDVGALTGGRLRAVGQRSVLPHSSRALDGEPSQVARVAPLPAGLGALRPVVLAGEAPLLSLAGGGRRLVAVFGAPLRRETTDWSLQRSFPLLWAELVELAAPRGEKLAGVLRSHEAGRATSTLGETPWHVGRYRDPSGRPVLGTVAAGLPPGELPSARSFSPAELQAIDTGRPKAPAAGLAPLLALLALLCATLSWWPPAAARDASKLDRQALPHP